MPQVIQLHRTTSLAAPAAPLKAGEPSVVINAGTTRMYLGDGTLNRLLLSSNPLDNAVGTQGFLRLTGGTMAGQIETMPPVAGPDAANKTYVDTNIANMRLFRGTWQVQANIPALPQTETAGDYYIAITANPNVPELAPGAIPGIGGTSIHNGDIIIWNETLTIYQHIVGGPLTMADANALYIQKSGDTMAGNLILPVAAPTLPTQATHKAYVDGLIGSYLPLTGGVLSGPLGLPGVPTAPNEAATKAYVDAHSAGVTSFNTRTGAIVLSGTDVHTALGFVPYDATNPALYQTQAQVAATVSNYVPLAGGVMTGHLTLNAGPTALAHAATKEYVDAAIGSGFTGVVLNGDGSLVGNGLTGSGLGVGTLDGGLY